MLILLCLMHAAMYREASEGIVKMAAEELSVDEWHADVNAALRARFDMYQARSHGMHMSRLQMCVP